MISMKMSAAQAIADAIGQAIPELLTNAKAMQDDEEETLEFPALRVLPKRLEFVLFQEDEIETDDTAEPGFADVELARIGEMEGDFELRLYCKSKQERGLLEERITELFLETERAPGTLPCPMTPLVIKGRQSVHVPYVGCSLDATDWDEERVFAKKRYSFTSTLVNFPVYIARTSAARITDLRLMVAASVDEAVLTATSPTEIVAIHDDGSITPSS